MPTPYGYSIFCDDIRQEVGNKLTLVGIYAGLMAFDTDFPVTIAKLCIVVNWVQGVDDEQHPVIVKVFHRIGDDDNLIIEGEFPVAGFEGAPKLMPDATLITASVQIALSPITFGCPGPIKVRAYYKGEEFKIGRLEIMKGPVKMLATNAPSAA